MNLFSDLAGSLRRPDFWIYAAWLDIVTKYRRTVLGILWVWVPPIVYIWGMGLFIGALHGVPRGPFIAHVGFGFLLFRLCTTVVIESTAVYSASRPLIYDGRTLLTDHLLRSLAKALLYLLLAAPLLALTLRSAPDFAIANIAPAALGFALVMLNLLWMGLLLSLLGARYPDLHELVSSVMMALFLITPIIWEVSAAPAGTLHGDLMRFNPIAHYLIVTRDVLLGEPVERLSWIVAWTGAIGGAVAAWLAYRAAARRVPLWI